MPLKLIGCLERMIRPLELGHYNVKSYRVEQMERTKTKNIRNLNYNYQLMMMIGVQTMVILKNCWKTNNINTDRYELESR